MELAVVNQLMGRGKSFGLENQADNGLKDVVYGDAENWLMVEHT